MSVMIRGMKMPNSCSECDFVASSIIHNGKYICECPSVKSCGKNVTEATEKGIRDLHCPLVEVQEPHGRLVDADALMNVYTKHEFSSDMGDAMEILDNFLTVIEAEGK